MSKPCRQCNLEYENSHNSMGMCRPCYKKFSYNIAKCDIRNKWNALRLRAKEIDKPLEISKIEYEGLLKSGCFYCGSDLFKFGGSSLDRIDNTLGYVVTNVVPCCKNCNITRNTLYSVEETKVMIQALLRHRESKV
jgi:hypothetical protein